VTTIQIVRKLLTPDELSNPNQRYNADCDCVQTSYDGGATWTDTPAADPRHFAGFLFPPVGGGDPQCLAAGNMTDKIKFDLDTIIASATIFGAATAVINILLVVLPGAGILIDLVLAICEALFDLGLATVNAALTTGVYDTLSCIIYCRIGSDGQCSAAQYALIRSDVDSIIGGVAAVAIDYALDQLGEVGLSNAGTIGESVRDCSGCACVWCESQHFAVSDNGYSIVSGEGGTYTGGVGFVGTNLNSGNNTDTGIEIVITPTQLTYVRFHAIKAGGAGANDSAGMRLWDGATLVYNGLIGGGSTGDYIHTFGSPTTIDKLQMFVNAGTSGAATGVTDAHIEGIGTNPFSGIADNCDD